MNHPTRRSALALSGLAALVLAGCGASGDDPLASSSTSSGEGGAAGSGESVVVGGADFSESVLLAEIYAAALSAGGVEASAKTGIGAREVYLKALDEGTIDVFPEYTGALALYYDDTFSETDPDKTYEALQGILPDGMSVLEKSQAEDNDSIVVTRETAESQSLSTIEDLKGTAGEMTLAAPPEFKERPQGIPGLEKTYGITFGSYRPLTAGQATVQALKNGQVDAANIFSTDPAIAANDFVVLEDTKKLFGSQNVVPLVRDDVKDQVSEVLNKVSAKLTTDNIAEMLKATDIDKKDPKQVAQTFVEENDLG